MKLLFRLINVVYFIRLKNQGLTGCLFLINYPRCTSSKQMLFWRYFGTFELRDVGFQGHFLDFRSSKLISKHNQFDSSFAKTGGWRFCLHTGTCLRAKPKILVSSNLIGYRKNGYPTNYGLFSKDSEKQHGGLKNTWMRIWPKKHRFLGRKIKARKKAGVQD